jgi:putative lipoprotein
MSLRGALLLFACLICATACSKRDAADNRVVPSSVATAVLTGTVSAAEPVKLDDNAILELSLQDVSADDGAVTLANKLLKAPGQLPLHYELPYESRMIQGQHRYTITARVLEGTQPIFVTDTPYPVITQGNPTFAAIQLVRSGGAAEHASESNPTQTVTVEGKLNSAEQTSTYRAYFQAATPVRIEEDIATAEHRNAHAEYEFLGARLQHYLSQDAAQGTTELKFDEGGKLVSAVKRQGGKTDAVAPAEVDALRNRAALLRSHALATREIREHRAATGS